jgi:hypothetical protein
MTMALESDTGIFGNHSTKPESWEQKQGFESEHGSISDDCEHKGKEKKVTARVCEHNDENNNLRRGFRILRAAWRYEWLPGAFSKGAIRGPRGL